MGSSSIMIDTASDVYELDAVSMDDLGVVLLQNRQLRAQATLDTISQINVRSGAVQEPLLHPQIGDGWCFFDL